MPNKPHFRTDDIWGNPRLRRDWVRHRIEQRIQEQLEHVRSKPGLMLEIRAAISGKPRRQAEDLVEGLITIYFGRELTYGCVRRLVEGIRA